MFTQRNNIIKQQTNKQIQHVSWAHEQNRWRLSWWRTQGGNNCHPNILLVPNQPCGALPLAGLHLLLATDNLHLQSPLSYVPTSVAPGSFPPFLQKVLHFFRRIKKAHPSFFLIRELRTSRVCGSTIDVRPRDNNRLF